MYRKTDTEKFERETSPARLQQKRMLIQGYEAQQA